MRATITLKTDGAERSGAEEVRSEATRNKEWSVLMVKNARFNRERGRGRKLWVAGRTWVGELKQKKPTICEEKVKDLAFNFAEIETVSSTAELGLFHEMRSPFAIRWPRRSPVGLGLSLQLLRLRDA